MLKHYKSTPNYWQHITKPLEQKLLDMGCKLQQMKEKFGELRVYWGVEDWGVREEADKLVEQAKEACSKCCIDCGEEGRFMVDENGYYGVLCDKHGKEEDK